MTKLTAAKRKEKEAPTSNHDTRVVVEFLFLASLAKETPKHIYGDIGKSIISLWSEGIRKFIES